MKIFISHSHIDKNFVEHLSYELINQGFYLWVDNYELEPNQTLDTSIHKAIDECSHFCFVLSASSVSSEWCLNELRLVLEKEKQEQRQCVYLLLLEDCTMPRQIKNRLSVDFRTSFDSGFNKLLFFLRKEKDLSYGNIYDDLYKRDYAMDWGITNFGPHGDFYMMEVTSISWEPNKKYSILAEYTFMGQRDCIDLYENFLEINEANKLNDIIIKSATNTMRIDPREYIIPLKDGKKIEKTVDFHCTEFDVSFTLVISARILGDLPDSDVYFDYASIIEAIDNKR
ncbi:toll/interleukin-1 receptor domain-containing protein [Paenibacillus odorifer]|uniref:toll/interleukin-1 receptor domain-containing protein n=1 Tax=Paenibacillus odorifer TaxID=189426 RepID=UPI000BA0CC2E|nr:toll/interleukin-1 receptor domain-containing protein [Paenibacillus odorifer]OZQ77439.1 hypothetical protein CA596_07690 [Paenibacillus odorifer]